ncbi:MAG: DUF805 domain-containing protein [Cocleimonas sp.]|nr:DUF805 domain-containing protein [Cocleimonas sp.]
MPNPYSTPESNLHPDIDNGKNDTTSPLSATGRFSRYSFLAWNFLLNFILMIIVAVIVVITGAAANLMSMEDPNAAMTFYTSGPGLIILFLLLISFIFSIIFFIRRLHDIEMSGWFALLAMIPLVNLFFGIFVLVKKGTEGENRFGPSRATLTWEKVLGIIAIILIVLYVVLLIGSVVIALMAGGQTY